MKTAAMFDSAGVSNENDEWYTPSWLFHALGVEFDLDPCSPGAPPSSVPAKRHLTKADNGLAADWVGRVLLTISDDDTISPCQHDCRHQSPSDAPSAERSSLSPWSISVPVPTDHSAFFHVAGSAWREATRSENAGIESSARENVGGTLNAESSNALSAGAPIQRHSSSSHRSQSASMDSHRGADSVQDNGPEIIERSSDQLRSELRRSGSNEGNTRNHCVAEQPKEKAHGCTTQGAGRENSDWLSIGTIPSGWTVSLPSEMFARTAAEPKSFIKTTSSRYPILNVPELLSATWSQPASDAISRKAPSIRVNGLKTKLRSLGSLASCGCFVGTYSPSIWLNPPFSSKRAWYERLLAHGNGIALMPARTETHDLQVYMTAAQALLFLCGRIYFERGHRPGANGVGGVTTSPPFGIVLCAYGEPMAKALLASKLLGVRAHVYSGLREKL